MTRSKMHLMHRSLEFAKSVGDVVGNSDPADNIPTEWNSSVSTSMIVAFQVIIFQLSVKYRRTRRRLSIGIDIGDGGISSNYFSTLCEMPTDVCPSVWTSVMVAFQVIIFQLSVKC